MATTDDPLMKPPSAETQRKINRWAARIIPLILIGAVGYATWVVVVLLCGALQHLMLRPFGV